ncbi:MAG: hypothetical protein NPIRA02_05230 [Nitrospirales bacterium]|nr:MAG: hypothetical protein NPIRA02_05230 [Nitrospirales bacterium]
MSAIDLVGNPRHRYLFSAIKTLLFDLSGADLDELDRSSTFLELGFDSLFLIQMSTAMNVELGIDISFRQLIEEIDTFERLLSYLDINVSKEVVSISDKKIQLQSDKPIANGTIFQDPVSLEVSPEAPILQSSTSLQRNSNGLESLIHQQLELMAQQLTVLKRAGSAMESTPDALLNKTNQDTENIQEPTYGSKAIVSEKRRAEESKPFGAIARITRGTTGALSSRQLEWLGAFIQRYNKRTYRSKDYAEEHRPHMADPRVVTGFKSKIKELIYPIVVDRTEGCHIWDIDGNEYVDALNGFGSNFFGYKHPKITQAVVDQLWRGVEIGPQSPIVGNLARTICRLTGMERAAFCNTGSEAVMGAMRMARTVTGRSLIAIFNGAYHGIFDEVLVRGTKNLRSVPAAPGILPSSVENVVVLDYGTDEALKIIRERAHELAAVMVEPIQSRQPNLRPREFLHEIREITNKSGAAFIFDEVITGFRLSPGGAQQYYNIRADIATYGKVIGGGMPIGVIAGKTRFMDALDGGAWSYGNDSLPEVGVTYFAGTFVRHPAAMAACQAAMEILQKEGPVIYSRLNEQTTYLCVELNTLCKTTGVPLKVESFSSLFRIMFTEHVPYGELLFYLIREKGVHIYDGFPCFLTMAHTDADVNHIIMACKESILELQHFGFLANSSTVACSSEESCLSTSSERQRGLESKKFSADLPQEINGGVRRDQNKGFDTSLTSAVPVKESFPLTEAQMEIWLASHMGDIASCAYNEPFILTLSGSLNFEVLESSIQTVLLRHEALHVRFDLTDAYQKQVPTEPIHIGFIDHSSDNSQLQFEKLQELLIKAGRTPFNLAVGPMVRVQIIKLSSEKHIVVFSAHHLVCDGWSWNVMLREISAAYSAKVQGRDYEFSSAASYRAYVENEIKEQNSEKTEKVYSYWMKELLDLPMSLDLPTDRSRPRTKTYNGATVTSLFDANLYKKIKEMAVGKKVSLFALTFAVFNVLLARLSNQHDLIVIVPTAGQLFVSTDVLVGHCVNSFPVRSRPEPSMPFTQFLSSTTTKIFEMYDNQGCTLGGIIKRLQIPRDTSRLPLGEVTFNLDRDGAAMHFHGLRATVQQAPKQAVYFDLFFNLNEGNSMLRIDIDYNRDLFDEETIQHWMTCYTTLLEGVVDHPETPIGQLPLLNEGEKRKLGVGVSQSNVVASREKLVHEFFETQVVRTPTAIAVVCGDHKLTYEELNTKANQVARYLQKIGVNPEKLVGLYMERSLELLVGLLGILKAGATYVPLDPIYPRERLAFILEDTRATVVVTQAMLREQLPEQASQVVCLDSEWNEIAQESGQNSRLILSDQQLAYVIYTSGSTGKPKGVMVTHANVTRLFQTTHDWFQFDHHDVWTLFHSYAFDFSVWEMWGAWLYGGRLIVVPYEVSRSPDQFYDLLLRENVTVLNQTPAAFIQLIHVDQCREKSQNLALRFVIFGGEKLEFNQLNPWVDRYGDECPRLINMYGITETTVFATYRPLRAKECLESSSPRSVIGRPLPDLELYILDDHQQLVPVGVPGEMYIGGAGVTRGYLNRSDLTQERFIHNPFSSASHSLLYKSGDLARWLPDGDIEFLGRSDHQVKIRGFRIEMGEVEFVLAQHPAVSEAVVIAKGNTSRERRLVAYMTSRNGTTASVDDLRTLLEKSLPFYMVPATFVWIDSLPLTANGKVDRKKLQSGESSLPKVSTNAYVAPRNSLERQIAAIWEEVLKKRPIGMTDNFFDLGGESFLAVRLAMELERVLKVKIEIPIIFQSQTIEKLSNMIHKDRKEENECSWIIPIQTHGSNPPIFCILFGNTFRPYMDVFPEQPLYMFYDKKHDGRPVPYFTVKELAAQYVKEMREIQPFGPYYLAGYSFGGLVAYEMGRQLHEQEQVVAFLALIDPTMPLPQSLRPSLSNKLKDIVMGSRDKSMQEYHQSVAIISRLTEISKDALSHGSRLFPKLRNRLRLRACRSYFRFGLPLPLSLRSFYHKHVALQAAKQYIPLPYAGEIVLFQTEETLEEYWRSLCASVKRVHHLPIGHRKVMYEPYAKTFYMQFMSALQEVQREEK